MDGDPDSSARECLRQGFHGRLFPALFFRQIRGYRDLSQADLRQYDCDGREYHKSSVCRLSVSDFFDREPVRPDDVSEGQRTECGFEGGRFQQSRLISAVFDKNDLQPGGGYFSGKSFGMECRRSIHAGDSVAHRHSRRALCQRSGFYLPCGSCRDAFARRPCDDDRNQGIEQDEYCPVFKGGMSRMILHGRNIKKSYGNDALRTKVLKGVDIDLEEGEFVSIMGKSGSGKSTLLNILSTLDDPDAGEICFEGREITHLREEEAARLRRESFGFVFQLPKMIRNLSILDNILLPSIEYRKNKKETIAKAKRLMQRIGIEQIADNRIFEASGGQLQRAGICRALINDPGILFADEPTGALDSKTGQEVLELFSAFHAEGKSILMVTHDIHVASRADRVLFMKDGMLVGELRLGADREEGLKQIQEAVNGL